MSTGTENPLLSFLDTHDDKGWAEAVSSLLPSVHDVDKAATRIWFAFFPLVVARALAASDEPERLAQRLQLQGRYRLAEQVDTSHRFLYGHRYWPEVKRVVVERAKAGPAPAGGSLVDLVREVAATAAAAAKVDRSLVTGIAAVALMTLEQVGLEAFEAGPGRVTLDAKHAGRSPERVLRDRARETGQGLLGLLRTVDKRWTVTFDENEEGCTLPAVNGQDLAMAGAGDRRDYASRDPRCVEGPIPVECRTAACGTCWVGVLGGAEKLSDVDDREWRKMKEFGYIDTDDPKPLIRLACRAKAQGSVSIVVPPWNGVFGKLVDGTLETEEHASA